jgi:hypothetical protein
MSNCCCDKKKVHTVNKNNKTKTKSHSQTSRCSLFSPPSSHARFINLCAVTGSGFLSAAEYEYENEKDYNKIN